MKTLEIFFALLRAELCGEPLSDDVKNSITEEKLSVMFKTAKAHDIANILASALEKNGILTDNDISDKFRQEQLLSIYRYQRIKHEIENISRTFEEKKIPYIPLKGSVIRTFYPEPWMRTSCDIDILVREEDIEKAAALLSDRLKYETDGKREFHDVSLHSPSGVHLELHFNILENLENIDKLLLHAWDHASAVSDGFMKYNFSNEFLLFHVLAHMSYHFIFGGCGIRPFIDLYLLEKNMEYDKEKLRLFCRECGIEKFYESVKKLSEVWFDGLVHDELTEEIQHFILVGGAYGDHKKGIAARQAKIGGKKAYAIKRIFQPYNVLKEKYPIIKKYPIFTPIFEVKRWFDLLLRGKMKSSIRELKANSVVTEEQSRSAVEFLLKLGL